MSGRLERSGDPAEHDRESGIGSATARWAIYLALSALIGLLAWLFRGTGVLNYDTAYALLWGRDLLEGHLPRYQSFGGVTPHPLLTLVSAAILPVGERPSYVILFALGFLSYGALVVATFALGRATFSWPAGLVGAALVALSPLYVYLGAMASKDIPFLALVVGALVLEAKRPRRGMAVLILLALAGLLRPEAWLLSAAYWLYLARGRDWGSRVRAGALAIVAPVIWVTTDLLVTGNPIYSLTFTRKLTGTLGRETGLGTVPSVLFGGPRVTIGSAAVLGGVVGTVLAVRLLPRERLASVAAMAIAVVGLAAIGAAGLPVSARYLVIVPVILAVLCGFAALGWRHHHGRLRTAWALGGALLLLALAAHAPSAVDQVRAQGAEAVRESTRYSGLVELTEAPASARLLAACGPIYVLPAEALGVQVPVLAHYAGRRANDLAPLDGSPRSGLILLPASGSPAARAPGVAPLLRRASPLAEDFRLGAGNRGWRIYERGCGSGRGEG